MHAIISTATEDGCPCTTPWLQQSGPAQFSRSDSTPNLAEMAASMSAKSGALQREAHHTPSYKRAASISTRSCLQIQLSSRALLSSQAHFSTPPTLRWQHQCPVCGAPRCVLLAMGSQPPNLARNYSWQHQCLPRAATPRVPSAARHAATARGRGGAPRCSTRAACACRAGGRRSSRTRRARS